MSALPAIAPEPQPRHVERGRSASRRRIRRAQRRGYVAFCRVVGAATLVALPFMVYVMLMANVTGLSYKLARIESQKADLLAASLRADERIAKLESRERLALLAARLKMRDPHVYAVVDIPAVPRESSAPPGVALLGAMNQWLVGATPDFGH